MQKKKKNVVKNQERRTQSKETEPETTQMLDLKINIINMFKNLQEKMDKMGEEKNFRKTEVFKKGPNRNSRTKKIQYLK